MNSNTGKITGRYVSALMDAMNNPIPASGTVTFTPQADYVISPNNATVVKTPIIAVLDSQGYICTADTSRTTNKYKRDLRGGYIPKHRGVFLKATDSPDSNPMNWTWEVEFNLFVGDQKVNQKSFSFELPSGSEIDLTTVTPVPGIEGYATVVGPKGDSVRFLDEQNPDHVDSPSNGDIVPFEGTLYGYSEGSWTSLGILPSQNNVQTLESTLGEGISDEIDANKIEAVSGDGFSFTVSQNNNSVTLTGKIKSVDRVSGQIPPEISPPLDIPISICSSEGDYAIMTIKSSGEVSVDSPGEYSVSITYNTGEIL